LKPTGRSLSLGNQAITRPMMREYELRVASLDYLVGALLQNPRHVEAERSGGLQFSLGQKLRMIALHKSQQPVATTSSF
jgi:hypothetical protein